MFPSPLGVSYFQIKDVARLIEKYDKAFPSPLGVSYFQIGFGFKFFNRFIYRFRPLSGYLISK